jgi:tRNA(adenine34) deaminase
MCVGAIVQARVRRLVYGAPDAKGGAIASCFAFPFETANHRPAVVGGVLAEECGALISSFFRRRRG